MTPADRETSFERFKWEIFGDAADDASLRLTPEELDPVLDGDWWGGPDILPPDHPSVFFSVTEQGAELARNPPSELKAHWYGNE